jgi:hypothetical protein
VTEDAPGTPHPGDELLRVAEAVHAGEVSVVFRPGPTVMAKVGDKLLNIAEASQGLQLTHPRLALRFVLDLGRILGERFRASDALAGPVPR